MITQWGRIFKSLVKPSYTEIKNANVTLKCADKRITIFIKIKTRQAMYEAYSERKYRFAVKKIE